MTGLFKSQVVAITAVFVALGLVLMGLLWIGAQQPAYSSSVHALAASGKAPSGKAHWAITGQGTFARQLLIPLCPHFAYPYFIVCADVEL